MNRWEWLLLFLGIFVLTLLIWFYFLDWGVFYRGLHQMKNQNYIQARKSFLALLSKNFNNSPARLNLAFVESLQENFENSLKEYGVVSKESDLLSERFQSYFNSGYLKSRMNDIDSALEFYQQALKEKPNSIEVKTNIELLTAAAQNSQQKDEDSSQENQNSSEKKEKDSNSPKELDKKDSLQQGLKKDITEESQGELSEDQLEFIIKEIEKKEQELQKKFNQKFEDSQQRGRQW